MKSSSSTQKMSSDLLKRVATKVLQFPVPVKLRVDQRFRLHDENGDPHIMWVTEVFSHPDRPGMDVKVVVAPEALCKMLRGFKNAGRQQGNLCV